MGGESRLSEKEKWAAYFSDVLKMHGYADAAKHLHVIAYGRHRPIDDFPVGLTSANKDYSKILNAIIDAQKELNSMPKHMVTKRISKDDSNKQV